MFGALVFGLGFALIGASGVAGLIHREWWVCKQLAAMGLVLMLGAVFFNLPD